MLRFKHKVKYSYDLALKIDADVRLKADSKRRQEPPACNN